MPAEAPGTAAREEPVAAARDAAQADPPAAQKRSASDTIATSSPEPQLVSAARAPFQRRKRPARAAPHCCIAGASSPGMLRR